MKQFYLHLITAILIGGISTFGIVFGFIHITETPLLAFSIVGGVFGLFLAVPRLLMPPFGYSWGDLE